MRGIVALIEAMPRSPVDGSAVPVRLIYNAVARADLLGEQWYPAIDTLPTFETDLAFDGVNYSQGATPTVGALGVAIGPDTAAYAGLVWHNAPVTLLLAPRPAAADPADADFAVAWTGRADQISEASGVFSIVVLDSGQALRRLLQPVKFGSSGSALLDGTDAVDKAGQVVPVGWGTLSAVPAILVDKTNNVWLVIGRPAASITSIEDGGAPFVLGVARATLADLQDNDPADGEADYCLDADGLTLVRPWTAPTYPLIVDLVATGGTTAAGIAATIVAARSALTFAAGVVAAFDALYPSAAQLYSADGKTVAETLDRIFPPLGAYWRLTSAGTIDIGRLAVAGAATRDLGYVLVNSITRKGIVMPTGRRTLGYATNNRVLSTNEIAQALTADNADAVGGVPAATIAAEIAAAAAAATAATTELAAIASDGVLTPVKKAIVIRDADVISAEQATLDAQALAFAVTTEKATYDAAVGALATYLDGLVAPTDWNDLTGNTAIDGPTFRGKFATVFDARTALLTAIAAAAASWPNQSGYGLPANFADVTAANIASGIAGQGALATMSNVGAGNLAVAIGGRNLMRNSSFDEGTALYLGWSPYNNTGDPTSYSLVAGRTGGQAIQMSFAGVPTSPKGIYLDGENAGIWFAGTTFVLSFYARSATGWATLGRTLALAWNHAPDTSVAVQNPPLTTDWERYIFRLGWRAGATVDGNGFVYVLAAGSGGLVCFDDMQIEEGDVASGYTPLTAANAAQLAYQDGQSVQALQPAEAAANVTASHTAAAIAGQGALATSTLTPAAVANANITLNPDGTISGAGGGGVTFGGLGGGAVGQLGTIYFGSPLLLTGPGGAGATNAAYLTSAGTAAAIAGQGALATRGYVSLGVGNGMTDESVTYWLTTPIVVTSSGTAAAIAGQGALATSTLTPAQVNNAAITLNADGTVSGGPFGSVTYAGLGGGALGRLASLYFGSPLLVSGAGVTATDAAYQTGLGTAAAIAGQGALATSTLTPAAVANANITLNADGTISGAGGGGVTFGGLGGGAVGQLGTIYFGSPLLLTGPGGAGATNAAYLTSAGTAAAIAGQGALATRGYVSLGVGNGMTDESVTYWLTTPIVVTSSGTAAAIAGQGALATSTLTPAQVNNAAITLNADGTVSGGPFGSVTYAGLGGGALGRLASLYFGSPLLVSGAGVTATDAAYQTGLGTAAAIAGQGALATSTLTPAAVANANITLNADGTISGGPAGSVTFIGLGGGALGRLATLVFGSPLLTSSTGTTATDAAYQTGLGTAAAIAGQGALATQSTVDYVAQVTGKPASTGGTVTVAAGAAITHYVPNGATVTATAATGATGASSGSGTIHATLLADGTVFGTGPGASYGPGEPCGATDTVFTATFTNTGAARVVSFTSGYTKTGGSVTIDPAQAFLNA